MWKTRPVRGIRVILTVRGLAKELNLLIQQANLEDYTPVHGAKTQQKCNNNELRQMALKEYKKQLELNQQKEGAKVGATSTTNRNKSSNLDAAKRPLISYQSKKETSREQE